MEPLLNTFLLFIAAIVALLSYLLIPKVPVTALLASAAILLAAGVWWHYTQFAVDYRTSTWQEQLRNYASYALLLVVILLSYAFYVFGWKGSSLADTAARAQMAVRNVGRRAATQIVSGASRAVSTAGSALLSESETAPAASSFNLGRTNTGRTNAGVAALE